MNELSAYKEAVDYATIKHNGQWRKGDKKIPYIVHPLNVAKILKQYSCSDEVIIAGILHDVVEDTPTPIEEIYKNFGAKVAELVASVTEKEDGISWDERLARYMSKVEKASCDTKMICAADKIDNMTSSINCLKRGVDIFKYMNSGKDEQLNKFQMIINKIGNDITPQMKNLYLSTLGTLKQLCKK